MPDVPIPYLSTPSRVVNQAIDILSQPGKIIGSITDGTPVSETARRAYGQGLRQLLRTAWWPFARKSASLTLLGDSTGQSALPISTYVEQPWTYAYEWPIDAVQGRWMPFNPPNGVPMSPSGIPTTTGQSALVQYGLMPARFLISSSDQYPSVVGVPDWDQMPDLQRTEGVGPVSRKIILTDCAQAMFVYTRLVTVIEEWDDLFRQAFVTMMALALVNVAIEEPKIRIAERDRLIPQLKNAVADARVASANEAGFPQSVDHQPAWISGRSRNWWGASAGFGGPLSGYNYMPFDSSFQWCGSVF